MKKIRASLGFIFTPDFKQVLLIRKRHPEWQAGKVNGIGGKCEGDESTVECMARELKEEAGLDIAVTDWIFVTSLEWQQWYVETYSCVYGGDVHSIRTMTDEEVEWFPVTALPNNVISNLRWLIPLAIDQLTASAPPRVVAVQYPS